jgi:hypothetical protein
MNLQRSLRIVLLLAASCLPLATGVTAQGAFVLLNERNHPELHWKEIRTDHFRIFFHEPLEPWARDAASILERFHGPLCRRLDVIPMKRTRVYLSDQDQIANGMAVGRDYFFVWIPSHTSSRSFAGGRSWFEEVLIHEYTHVLVEWASRTWLGNLAYPLGLTPPRWLHEGVAQWTAETWNVLRGDGTISAAILDEGLARWPKDGRLLYAQGNARVRWLAETYGDSTISRLIRPKDQFGLYSYSAAERRALGNRAAGSYGRFRREMISFYGERYRLGENPDSIGVQVRTGLSVLQRAAEGPRGVSWWTGQSESRRPEASLFRKQGSGRPIRVVEGGVTGRAAPLTADRALLPRWHRSAHGSIVQDLGVWDRALGFRFLTSGERIVEVDTLSGGRLVAIADSPMGNTLIQSPLPTSGGHIAAEPIFRWPRGWGIHSLASSEDGKRLVVSATEPDGRRGIWGLKAGRLEADSLRLSAGSEEAHGSVWLDTLRIAWTSYAGGLSQVHTGRWPLGQRLEADSARTALGTGVELVGRRGDSLLVMDRTSRESSPTLRIDPNRHVRRAISRQAYPFQEGAAVEPVLDAPAVTGPFPYRPRSEIRSWFQLPLLGPEAGKVGAGWAGLWAEPLLRHAFAGYIYANHSTVSNPDRALVYLTTRFGPWITLHHLSAILPRRILDERLLWERRETTGLSLLSPLHRESDPNLSGWVNGFVRADSRIPRRDGRDLSTPLGPPRSWSSLRVALGGGFIEAPPHGVTPLGIRNGEGIGARIEKGIDAWEAASEFFRGSAQAFLARELDLPARPIFWFSAGYREASQEIPPQEFEGFDSETSSLLISGFPGITGTVHVRGWPEARAARNVIYGTCEIRLPLLPDPGLRGPGVAIQGGTIAPFIDSGHAWGRPSAAFSKEQVRVTGGFEARLFSRLGPLPLIPTVAWGRPFGGRDPGGDWSWRITTSAPIAVPPSLPRALRWLLGAQLKDDCSISPL